MAETLVIHAAKGSLEKLLSLANDQIQLAWGFKQDLTRLCKKLKIIHCLLDDAENQKMPSKTMVEWLKNLKATTYKAEDVLDELAYEHLRRTIEVRIRSKVRDLLSLSDPLSFRFKMANKVNNINMLLDEVCEEGKGFGLVNRITVEKHLGPSEEHLGPSELRLTHPFINHTQIVGRVHDVSVVVKMLLGSDVEGDLPVTAIVGMAGLGKTTLAQLVYIEAEVLNNFKEKIWICVSDSFDLVRLLKEMGQSLKVEQKLLETKNIEALVTNLGGKLEGKKYLLVLDDLWNTDTNLWVKFKNSLIGMGGSKESKILVTTRSENVVSAMHTSPSCTHRLKTPSEDDCWTMFERIAFDNGGPKKTKTLEETGKRLVAKCKGVPLAINALGGLLYSKVDEGEWKSIENAETWSILESNDGILPVLRLSFDHLPSPSLKQSFAYCSIFPKDKVIVKDELIQLWMAIECLQPSSRSKEEVGNEYFKTLWRNSLFQEVEFDEYNNITTCKMHDLVHDLAVHVQHHFSFEETGLDILEGSVGKLRTLFLKEHDLPKTEKVLKWTRALLLVDHSWKRFPSLSKSIHLRFLDISETDFEEIPNCITKLYNLETLKLPSCTTKLPKDFHNLVSLRHFYIIDFDEDITRDLMPINIGKLTSLQTLPFFDVGQESGRRLEELATLSKLAGSLHVYDLQHVKGKEEAKKAKILEKPGIQDLEFHWDKDLGESNNFHEDVLEGLNPHPNVKALKLVNYKGGRLASWITTRSAHSLQNLVKIKLSNCGLCGLELGHLPNLAQLEMEGLDKLKTIGPEFYGVGATRAFPALTTFKLFNMCQLEEWSDALPSPPSVEFFPLLQKLAIEACPKLITLPEATFNGSTSIQQLRIEDCPELMCLPKGMLQPTLEEITLNRCSKITLPVSELKCQWGQNLEESTNKHGDVLEDVKPHGNVKGLSLENFGGIRWASWMSRDACPLQKLVKIELRYCTSCEQVLALGHLMHLEVVKLRSLHNLKRIGPEFYGHDERGSSEAAGREVFPALSELTLDDLPQLEEWSDVSSSLASATSMVYSFLRLKILAVFDCPKLIGIPEAAFNGSASLHSVWIWDCPELKCLPKGLLQPTLKDLELNGCSKIRTPDPDVLRELKSLEELSITSCPNWGNYWEEGLFCTANIKRLEIGEFGRGYRYFPWPSTSTASPQSSHFTFLNRLNLFGRGMPKVKSLPDQLEHLPALGRLHIYFFSGLESLPECLSNLSSLQELTIENCPLLNKRCEKGTGEDWHKISHIPFIEIEPAVKIATRCEKGTGEDCHKISHIREITIDGELIQHLE